MGEATVECVLERLARPKSLPSVNDCDCLCLQQSSMACATLGVEMAQPNSWDGYRKRRNLALFAFIGYVPNCVWYRIAVNTSVLYVRSRLRSGHCVDGVLRHRWKPCSTLSVPEMRKVVFRKMVVPQQLCATMCPLWFAEVRRTHSRQASMSEIAWLQQLSLDYSNYRSTVSQQAGLSPATATSRIPPSLA